MGIIKDRNCKDLIEADKIKNHGKNTQKSYTHTHTHNLNDPYSQNGVVTHLEPNILEASGLQETVL